jgi:hypothetical protein
VALCVACMVFPLGMPTRKPFVVGILSIHWVVFVMSWLVHPESRTAFSAGEGTRVLSVMLQ